MTDEDVVRACRAIQEQLDELNDIATSVGFPDTIRAFERIARWQEITADRVAESIGEKERDWFRRVWHGFRYRTSREHGLDRLVIHYREHLEALLAVLKRKPENIVQRGTAAPSAPEPAAIEGPAGDAPSPAVPAQPADRPPDPAVTGMTFWDYLHRVGFRLIVGLAISAVAVSIIVHFLAAPGTVVFGIYTKSGAAAPAPGSGPGPPGAAGSAPGSVNGAASWIADFEYAFGAKNGKPRLSRVSIEQNESFLNDRFQRVRHSLRTVTIRGGWLLDRHEAPLKAMAARKDMRVEILLMDYTNTGLHELVQRATKQYSASERSQMMYAEDLRRFAELLDPQGARSNRLVGLHRFYPWIRFTLFDDDAASMVFTPDLVGGSQAQPYFTEDPFVIECLEQLFDELKHDSRIFYTRAEVVAFLKAQPK